MARHPSITTATPFAAHSSDTLRSKSALSPALLRYIDNVVREVRFPHVPLGVETANAIPRQQFLAFPHLSGVRWGDRLQVRRSAGVIVVECRDSGRVLAGWILLVMDGALREQSALVFGEGVGDDGVGGEEAGLVNG